MCLNNMLCTVHVPIKERKEEEKGKKKKGGDFVMPVVFMSSRQKRKNKSRSPLLARVVVLPHAPAVDQSSDECRRRFDARLDAALVFRRHVEEDDAGPLLPRESVAVVVVEVGKRGVVDVVAHVSSRVVGKAHIILLFVIRVSKKEALGRAIGVLNKQPRVIPGGPHSTVAIRLECAQTSSTRVDIPVERVPAQTVWEAGCRHQACRTHRGGPLFPKSSGYAAALGRCGRRRRIS